MTTIVWRDGIVAADSRALRGTTIMPEEVEKLWRVNESCVAGLSGLMMYTDAAKAWTMTEDFANTPPPAMKDATLVVFWPTKIVEYSDGQSAEVRPTHGYYAWGSGCETAYGALAMGADAVRAVLIAAMFDGPTGGKILSMPVEAHVHG